MIEFSVTCGKCGAAATGASFDEAEAVLKRDHVCRIKWSSITFRGDGTVERHDELFPDQGK